VKKRRNRAGWTEAEAEHQASLWRIIHPRSVYRVVFDDHWGEWSIVTSRDGEPDTISRRPRKGLRTRYPVTKGETGND
jgi:hypothetical protein